MKIYTALLSGCCFGFFVGLACVQNIPSLNVAMSSAEASQIQPEAPLDNAEAIRFTHKDEGSRLQINSMLDYKGYDPTEGKKAELFKLDQQCKIRVTLGGEDSLVYRTFYFSDQQLMHALASTYYYPNDTVSDGTLTQSLFSDETLNSKNPLVLDEFKYLSQQFTPEQIKTC